MEDLSLTQINAYVLEYVKAQKAELDAMRAKTPTKNITPDSPINSLKGLGVKIKVRKKN